MHIDFFQERTQTRNFQEVVDHIAHFFEIIPHWFRVGDKVNNDQENQRACAVIAYATYMWYTFEQTQALFAEHHHFSIAIPVSRKTRNIYQINQIYIDLLKKWANRSIKIKDFPDLISVPASVLTLKV